MRVLPLRGWRPGRGRHLRSGGPETQRPRGPRGSPGHTREQSVAAAVCRRLEERTEWKHPRRLHPTPLTATDTDVLLQEHVRGGLTAVREGVGRPGLVPGTPPAPLTLQTVSRPESRLCPGQARGVLGTESAEPPPAGRDTPSPPHTPPRSASPSCPDILRPHLLPRLRCKGTVARDRVHAATLGKAGEGKAASCRQSHGLRGRQGCRRRRQRALGSAPHPSSESRPSGCDPLRGRGGCWLCSELAFYFFLSLYILREREQGRERERESHVGSTPSAQRPTWGSFPEPRREVMT